MTDRTAALADPDRILKGFSALVTLTGIYPSGHPLVHEKLREVHDGLQQHLNGQPSVELDVIRGVVHLNGVASDTRSDGYGLAIDSLHVHAGVRPEEIGAVAEFLSRAKIDPQGEPVRAQLARRGVEHVSVGRLVPLDTRWRSRQWPDRPEQVLDPDYEESLALAQHAFDQLSSDRVLDIRAVGDLVRLLMFRVVASHAALAQILTVKQYENLTYVHSVNVAVLSLLIGRQIGIDEETLPVLVEAAVLHDVGKTRIPLDLVKKPGALDKRERKMMEAHPVLGAELLMQVDGLRPATALVALEHHRTVLGGGYPDIGDGVVPHVLSQIVSVADIYEAVTGARSYQVPTPPERACLLLARLAGTKLNASLVKAFVSAISFFPIGSLVRTSREELGVVIRTNPHDPLHPVLQLVDEQVRCALGQVDTAIRGEGGDYDRHVVETVASAVSAPEIARFVSSAA